LVVKIGLLTGQQTDIITFMNHSYDQIYDELKDQLKIVDLEEDDVLKKSEQSFRITLKVINQLRDKLINELATFDWREKDRQI
jgi:hypothetical protein